MEMLWLGVALGAGGASFLWVVGLLSRAGSLDRALWGLTIAGRARQNPAFAESVQQIMAGLTPSAPAVPPILPAAVTTTVAPTASAALPPPAPIMPRGEAYRLLMLLQQEAGLVDFLTEDLSQAPIDTIGHASKEIHHKASQVFRKHLELAPVIDQNEGDTVTVPVGFDPSMIRVVGHVTGQPPFRGVLRHRGWRVQKDRLPKIPEGQNEQIIQPAEVEIEAVST